MFNQNNIQKIKEITEEFFQKMTISVLKTDVDYSSSAAAGSLATDDLGQEKTIEAVNISIRLAEPQILIGEKGQTLFETQRILRMILNKKLQAIFYLNLDINEYKKKKTEYLKELAKDLANEVSLTKEERVLLPMPAYERRIIHAELSGRTDIATESRGEGQNRRIVIKPS